MGFGNPLWVFMGFMDSSWVSGIHYGFHESIMGFYGFHGSIMGFMNSTMGFKGAVP